MTRINIREYLHLPKEPQSSCDIGLTQEQRDELLEAFTLHDKDEDGLIDTKDIATVIRSMGQVPTICEETDIVAQFAQEKCYEIDYIAFVRLMRNKYKIFDEDDELRESFRRFDKEENGYLSTETLKSMLMTIGEPLSRREVDDWLADASEFIQNDQLFYESFSTFMLSK